MKEYEEGRRAYKNGQVVCPYASGRQREDWIRGWESMYYNDRTQNAAAMNAKWHASGQYWGR